MTAWRQFLVCVGVLGTLALAAPGVTLAQGGGSSAGDNQYVNPLGGSGSGSSSGNSGGSPSSGSPNSSSGSGQSAPAPTTPSSVPTSSGPAATSSSSGSDSSGPTATTASDPGTTGSSGSTQTLPYTGFRHGLAGAFGQVLLASRVSLHAIVP